MLAAQRASLSNDEPFELPLIYELRPMPEAEAVFLQLCRLPHCIYFDSALRHAELGRYSFVAADPFAFLTEYDEPQPPAPKSGQRSAIARLGDAIAPYTVTLPTRIDQCGDGAPLPPFQGGAAGLFGYELLRQLERTGRARFDEFGVPVMAIGLYDTVVAFDHLLHRAWIISQGFPELEPRMRRRRAAERIAQFRAALEKSPSVTPIERAASASAPTRGNIPITDLAPQFPLDQYPGLTSNFSRQSYLDAVRRVIEYIRAGDIFQVNLSQRLLLPTDNDDPDDAVALYLRLRQRNPAPFAGYFDAGEFQIASASPERFLSVRGKHVETRPIKGTRARLARPEADLFASDDLLASEKDRAENVMIVDLLRNDLSRVCTADSVRVTQLCQVEHYQFVQHLVSAVCGDLDVGRTALDLLAAAFPGGSITGAPKIRATEIIAELEPTARGAYCGALGYLGFDGALDTNLLIRTITTGRGWRQLPVGGGIVALSSPEREYAETWHKAEGLLRALR